jgi:hypothetical protein
LLARLKLKMIKHLGIVAIGMLMIPFGLTDRGKDGSMRFPVYLNHFYLTLDHATYEAIRTNHFLRDQLAVTEERTTVRKDRTYTGLYFYGTNTYFEFFDADTETRRRVGDSAIAFGVEEPGASEKLAQALGTQPVTITRQLAGADIPWFLQTMPKGISLESGIATWVMEYHPRFLPEWHPEAGGNAGISRKDVLHRYKAVLTGSPAQPYLTDVVAITLAASAQVSRQMIELSKVFGYGVQIDAEIAVLRGPDFELRIVPASGSTHGIQEVSLRLRQSPANNRELRFGSNSVLRFHSDGRATWSF